jgi:DNA-binding MarR family transcriptional regulator
VSDAIRQRREVRRRFLEFLYRASEEEASEYRDGYEVAEDLEIPRQDAERIVRYLEDHGFVTKSGGMGMVVRITARGIDHVERTISGEDDA